MSAVHREDRKFVRMRTILAATLLAGGSATLACGPPPQSAPRPDPGVLHAPSEYPGAFLDRQTIVATYGKKSAKFDAVLQKRDDEVVLLGMTPFGSRAFSLKQTGLQVAFESFVPQELPFPPQYILFDVQRVFFEGTLPGSPAPADGARELPPRDGEVMTEYWQGGRLLQRRIRRSSGDPAGEIVIVYEGGMPLGGPPPQHIAFTNGWYGYRLDITTLSHQPL